LQDHVPKADCAVQERLEAGGAVLLGKVGAFEFAIGGPAALCGVVGLKPTYGRVSRRGVFPLAYSLDHCGPLSWSVEDAALTMQAITGYDPADPASADAPAPNYAAALAKGVSGLKIGYIRKFFLENPFLTQEALTALDSAAATLGTLGAVVEEVEFPALELFDACAQVIMFAEAYAIHEGDLKTRPYAYGRYAYQRIVAGAVLSAADLMQAQRLRRELTSAVNGGPLKSHHALLAPSSLSTAATFASFGKDVAKWGACSPTRST
jgi:aspartyl-tRNA(Asn)/glutamyl-tRNA(Gln) amidotransferase subunit A